MHFKTAQTFLFNFILLAGPEFNCTVGDFLCPWFWSFVTICYSKLYTKICTEQGMPKFF